MTNGHAAATPPRHWARIPLLVLALVVCGVGGQYVVVKSLRVRAVQQVLNQVPLPPDATLVYRGWGYCHACTSTSVVLIYATHHSPTDLLAFYQTPHPGMALDCSAMPADAMTCTRSTAGDPQFEIAAPADYGWALSNPALLERGRNYGTTMFRMHLSQVEDRAAAAALCGTYQATRWSFLCRYERNGGFLVP